MSSAVRNKIKIIVTLGPATHTEEYLRKIKERGVDFARINMSHSSLDDLRYFIALAKKIGIPFIIDTEGSQVRTGEIISKIECVDALHNLDEIILKSDYLLLDRGDLSKEIPIEKIPLAQKTIINRAHNLIKEAAVIDNFGEINQAREKVAQKLERMNYLSAASLVSSLIAPHGGKLVDGMAKEVPNATYLNSLEKIALNQNLQMDAEQIAIGAFSPLEGFMKRDDLQSVLDKMCLTSGIVWTVPVVLDVSPEQADRIKLGEEAALINERGEIMATLLVEDKYQIDKTEFNQNMYGTNDLKHPGVRWVNSWQEVLLGGRINLIKRRSSPYKEYELTPRQVR